MSNNKDAVTIFFVTGNICMVGAGSNRWSVLNFNKPSQSRLLKSIFHCERRASFSKGDDFTSNAVDDNIFSVVIQVLLVDPMLCIQFSVVTSQIPTTTSFVQCCGDFGQKIMPSDSLTYTRTSRVLRMEPYVNSLGRGGRWRGNDLGQS
jgi:hypothetical protein